MSDWTQRLQRLQAEQPPPEVPSIDHLSLDMLKVETVKFGKTHQGKTYEEVWSTDPSWTKWFLTHYQKSTNLEHRKVIRYLQMKIEEAEKATTGVSQMPVMPRPKAAPKSLAATAKMRPAPSVVPENSMGPAPHPDAFPENMMQVMAEAPWVEQEEMTGAVNQLQSRMTSLELALQQILVHLTPVSANAAPMSSTDPELPEISLADEWNDPWNQ